MKISLLATSPPLRIDESRRQVNYATPIVCRDADVLKLSIDEHFAFGARLVAIINQQLQENVLRRFLCKRTARANHTHHQLNTHTLNLTLTSTP
jgi:hypothetical protein